MAIEAVPAYYPPPIEATGVITDTPNIRTTQWLGEDAPYWDSVVQAQVYATQSPDVSHQLEQTDSEPGTLDVRIGWWACFNSGTVETYEGDNAVLLAPINTNGTNRQTEMYVYPDWMVTAVNDGDLLRICLEVTEIDPQFTSFIIFRDGETIAALPTVISPIPVASISNTFNPLQADGTLEVGQDFNLVTEVTIDAGVGPKRDRQVLNRMQILSQGPCPNDSFPLPNFFSEDYFFISQPIAGIRIQCAGAVYVISTVKGPNFDNQTLEMAQSETVRPINNPREPYDGDTIYVFMPVVGADAIAQ